MGDDKMKPVVVLPLDQVSKEDIELLRANGICAIEAKDPSLVRYSEPFPQGYAIQEEAAISLARILLRDGLKCSSCNSMNRRNIGQLYADIIINGWPFPPVENVPAIATTKPRTK